jgi:opacity protein-like surface antigen
MIRRASLLALALFATSLSVALAAEPTEEQAALYKQFEEMMNGAQMKGQFTIDGKEGPAKQETYTIEKVTRLDIDDLWRFDVQMKYGDVNRTMPIAVPVKWVGKTPVVALDKTAIPNLGTFSAYVVFAEGKYAGTWSHEGKGGGHMFGTIEKAKKD